MKRENELRKQVKEEISYCVGGYENNYLDDYGDDYHSVENLINEIYENVLREDNNDLVITDNKNLKFLGTEKIKEVIKEELIKDYKNQKWLFKSDIVKYIPKLIIL